MVVLAAAITGVAGIEWGPSGCARDALGMLAVEGCTGVAAGAGVAITGAIRRGGFGAG